MTTKFVILSAQKPAYGAPCNGCGMCCQNEACQLSIILLGSRAAPCVALEWDGAQYRCGLMAQPSKYLDAFGDIVGGAIAEMLGVGKGCDANSGYYGGAR